MQFIEFPYFTKWVVENLSDDEYQKIQEELIKTRAKGILFLMDTGLENYAGDLKIRVKAEESGLSIIFG